MTRHQRLSCPAPHTVPLRTEHVIVPWPCRCCLVRAVRQGVPRPVAGHRGGHQDHHPAGRHERRAKARKDGAPRSPKRGAPRCGTDAPPPLPRPAHLRDAPPLRWSPVPAGHHGGGHQQLTEPPQHRAGASGASLRVLPRAPRQCLPAITGGQLALSCRSNRAGLAGSPSNYSPWLAAAPWLRGLRGLSVVTRWVVPRPPMAADLHLQHQASAGLGRAQGPGGRGGAHLGGLWWQQVSGASLRAEGPARSASPLLAQAAGMSGDEGGWGGSGRVARKGGVRLRAWFGAGARRPRVVRRQCGAPWSRAC